MGKETIWSKARYWIGWAGWQIWLWSVRMTEEAYQTYLDELSNPKEI